MTLPVCRCDGGAVVDAEPPPDAHTPRRITEATAADEMSRITIRRLVSPNRFNLLGAVGFVAGRAGHRIETHLPHVALHVVKTEGVRLEQSHLVWTRLAVQRTQGVGVLVPVARIPSDSVKVRGEVEHLEYVGHHPLGAVRHIGDACADSHALRNTEIGYGGIAQLLACVERILRTGTAGEFPLRFRGEVQFKTC